MRTWRHFAGKMRALERRGARAPVSALSVAIYRRDLHFERLEERRLLANVTVSKLTDVVDGNTTSIAALVSSPGADGGISLREAILAANVDNTDPADTILFAPSVTGVIQLTNVGHVGEIVINNNLTINGPGARLLTIQAFAGTPAAGNGARIFNVDDGVAAVKTVSISGLALTGGDPGNSGGAIRNAEDLTVADCTISGNTAGTPSIGFHGGGIFSNGTLTVTDSTISGNTVLFGRGGGIYASGTLNISKSTISGNFVSSTGSGGGVYSNYATTTIDSSTISGNEANLGGGVVQVGIGRLMTITNSTISENRSRVDGGGVVAMFGDVNLRHCTITLNRCDNDLNMTGNGGGVMVVGPVFSNMSLDHTIVAGNLRGVSGRSDAFGTLAARFTLIGDNTGATITNNGGNQIGTGASPIDAKLVPGGAFDNGGPTLTHALLPGSPAIDAGDPSFAAPPANDQRGAPFVRVADGDGVGGARIDIGAYERQTLAASSFVVDTLVDELDGDYSPGDVSLREAVSAANGSPGANTITFAPALTSGGPATIVLTKGDMWLAEAATITGPGADLLTIDASGSDPTPALNNGDGSRIFTINSTNQDFVISGLTLTGGDISTPSGYGIGGAIFNGDLLTLTGCVIKDNSADHGGGIGNRFAQLQMTDCTISGNTANLGAGIYIAASPTTINSSTISGNVSSNHGGGIAGGPVTLIDSIISGNEAEGYGGGIYGRPTVTRSTITGNSAHDGGGIWNDEVGTITVESSTISGNTVADSGGAIYSRLATVNVTRSTLNNNISSFNGGAIANESGPLVIADSTLSGNKGHFGGAVFTTGSTFSLSGSTVDNNEAYFGGGLYCEVNNPTITNSTISRNRAVNSGATEGTGGGIFFIGTLATVTDSTISGNSAIGHGGGIEVTFASQVSLQRSTVTNNIANTDGDGNGRGGGIHHNPGPGFLVGILLDHTIVAGNIIVSGGVDDLFGGVQARFSLIGNNSGISTFVNLGGNLIGTGVMTINPLLGALSDNGGPTKTHALLAGSPAIDAGDPAAIAGMAGVPFVDQRGFPFSRVFDGDGMNGPRIDIGAYEIQTVANLSLVVDTLVDESDGNYSAGDMSLREAIGLANGSVGVNIVTFAAALTSGGPAKILLDKGELAIRDALTLPGPGANLLTIDASGNDPTPDEIALDGSRIFDVDDYVAGSGMAFTTSGLTLTGGDHFQEGGAIQSHENVVISNCVIIGNAAVDGGGIFMDEGNLTMTGCLVIGNEAADDGGGIYVDDGTSTITASVIQGNTAGDSGGGIVNIEKVDVVSTTVSGNTADFGGGIFNRTQLSNPDRTLITNSTISGNTATVRGGGVYDYRGLTILRNSTITDNSAPAGMGSGVGSRGDSLTRTEVHSSIIAGNDNSDVDFVNGVTNSFQSLGFNLVGNGNATTSPLNAFTQTGDQVGANPLLGPLADNGGPTKTHALLPGSSAINAGDPAAVAGVGSVPNFDQRGAPFTRVSGGRIDIGAVERQPILPAVFGDYNQNGVVDAADYVVWRKTLANSVTPFSGADGDGDGVVDQDDYGVWRAHFGSAVPASGVGSGANVETGVVSAKLRARSVQAGVQPVLSVDIDLAVVTQRSELVVLDVPKPSESFPRRLALPAAAGNYVARRHDGLVAWVASLSDVDLNDGHEADSVLLQKANFVSTASFAAFDAVFERVDMEAEASSCATE